MGCVPVCVGGVNIGVGEGVCGYEVATGVNESLRAAADAAAVWEATHATLLCCLRGTCSFVQRHVFIIINTFPRRPTPVSALRRRSTFRNWRCSKQNLAQCEDMNRTQTGQTTQNKASGTGAATATVTVMPMVMMMIRIVAVTTTATTMIIRSNAGSMGRGGGGAFTLIGVTPP